MNKYFFLTILSMSELTLCLAQNWSGVTPGDIYYNSGDIGIGIPNPRAKLHLEGEGDYKSNAWFGKSFINDAAYHYDHARVGISGAANSGQYGAGVHFQARNMANTNFLHAIIGQSRHGSIIFENGGAGTAPPTEKMTILPSGDVGIGISNPRARLHLEGEGDYKSNAWFGKGFINDAAYHYDHARVGISGTASSGQYGAGIHFQVRNNANTNYLHAIISQSREGSIVFENGGAGVTPPTERMTILSSGDVGIGTTAPDAKLTVKGDIHAEEVRVDLNVPAPDYVFAEDYDLPSLESISAYIKANQHLPEVPSAEEMEENGIDLGVMNMLLLKKVEELTLHLIEQSNMNHRQNKKIESQDKLIRQLQSQIGSIQTQQR